MRFNKLDLNLLVAFDAIASELNVSRAAVRLNLSQSATSSALSRLREFFDDPLFVQAGRSLRPTPVAQEIIAPVRKLLADVQQNVISRNSFDPQTARLTFAIAASDYIIRVYLSRIAQSLASDAPGIRLDILPLTGASVREKIMKGEVDFMIIPDGPSIEALPSLALISEPFVVVACAKHGTIQGGISRAAFEEAGHVAVRLGQSRFPGLDESVCEAVGVKRRIEMTCGAFDHVPSFVTDTQRIAMMQKGLAEYYAQHYPLQVLPLPFDAPLITEVIQWQPYATNSPAHEWFKTYAARFF